MEGGMRKEKKVMVGIDESECSFYALNWALETLGETIQNSELVLFTAQPITSDFIYTHAARGATVANTAASRAPPELMASKLENHKRAALALLHKAKDICANHGFVAEVVTEVGEPKEAICEAVEKLNIQLLVVGSHNRGALQRAFLGSVSNHCVQNAKCPVLVVRKSA